MNGLINDNVVLLIAGLYEEQSKKLTGMKNAIKSEYHDKLESLHQASRPEGPMNEWVVAFKKAGVNKTPELVEKVAEKMRGKS